MLVLRVRMYFLSIIITSAVFTENHSLEIIFIRLHINWAIDVINAIPGVNISKLQEVNLPKLYKGGTAITAGAALVGERGPEIIDMPKGASVIPLDRARRDGDTYDYTTKNYSITVNIEADGKSADEIVNELVPKLKLALSNI